MSASRRALRIAFYALPLVVAVVARMGLPSYFEFESQEDTVRTVAMLEKGEIPLYGIGHVRFLAAALGPLVYYFKAIPYAVVRDPAGELLWLMLWHLAGILFATLLVRDVVASLAGAGQGGSRQAAGAERAAGTESLLDVADVAAVAAGGLLALSMHSLGLTSHAHPSNFAATMVPIFTWSVHRWLLTRKPRSLLLAGALLGIMSQLYQLTLFLPALLVAWCVAWPRLPDRKAVVCLLAPVAVCYVPYLLSELATGFFNTRNLFVFAPGPQDDGMVGTSSMEGNFLTLASSIVQHRFLAAPFDAFWLGLAAIGLLRLLVASIHSRSARFFLLFLPFYTLLPATVLGAPRYQLSQPAAQLLVVLGGLSVWQGWGSAVLGRRRWAGSGPGTSSGTSTTTPGPSLPVARLAVSGATLVALVTACALLSGSDAGRRLREPAFYPMRVVAAEPAARTPSLAVSRDLLALLHEQFGVGLATLSARVHSTFAATGLYGEHYILRTIEKAAPSSEEQSGPTPPLLVVDELFPWSVAAMRTVRMGHIEVHELPAGAELPSFTLRIDCPEPWCSERASAQRGSPAVRFFWGCGEFRDLDEGLGIPAEQCEALLQAPPHTRRYFGHLAPRTVPPACSNCSDVLWLGAADSCKVDLLLDSRPVEVEWQQVKERRLGTALLPPLPPSGSRLVITVADCVPWYLDAVRFSGVRRAVPQVVHE